MNTDNDDQIEKLKEEIWTLRERIANIEGRREGTFRILAIAATIVAVLSFATILARINTVVDQQVEKIMEQQIRERIESPEFQQQVLAQLKGLVEQAQAAANDAQDAVTEAADAVEKAQIAASDSKASATLTADKAVEVSENADDAEKAADMAVDQAQEAAARVTEVQSVLATPTATPSAP